MRLTCPSCGARYEIEDSMLPPEGRDVQCSNCGTMWFQPGRRTTAQPGSVLADTGVETPGSQTDDAAEAEPAEDSMETAAPGPAPEEPDAPGSYVPDPEIPSPYAPFPGGPSSHGPHSGMAPKNDAAPEAEREPEPEPELEPDAEPAAHFGQDPPHETEPVAEAETDSEAKDAPQTRVEAAFGPEPDPWEDADERELRDESDAEFDDDEAEAPDNGAELDDPLPVRREMDPAILDILREEAAREARLRKGAGTVETQDELPLSDGDAPPGRARRSDNLEELEDDLDTDVDSDGVSRRDLLPDIEEINSTLRAAGDRSSTEESASDIETLDMAPRRRRGVRIGFFSALLLAAAGVALYANSEQVAAAMPTAAPLLETFTETVDDARFWLDDMARNLAEGIG